MAGIWLEVEEKALPAKVRKALAPLWDAERALPSEVQYLPAASFATPRMPRVFGLLAGICALLLSWALIRDLRAGVAMASVWGVGACFALALWTAAAVLVRQRDAARLEGRRGIILTDAYLIHRDAKVSVVERASLGAVTIDDDVVSLATDEGSLTVRGNEHPVARIKEVLDAWRAGELLIAHAPDELVEEVAPDAPPKEAEEDEEAGEGEEDDEGDEEESDDRG